MPRYKVFIGYIGNEYGMKVARSVDRCLWKHHWIPRIELSGTHGEIHANGEHDTIDEERWCDAFLGINSEGAINKKKRLKFWIEVSKALFEFGKPTVAMIQAHVPTLHYLKNTEVRRVDFVRGRHRRVCDKILTELKAAIENSAAAPGVPLNAKLPRRKIHAGT